MELQRSRDIHFKISERLDSERNVFASIIFHTRARERIKTLCHGVCTGIFTT